MKLRVLIVLAITLLSISGIDAASIGHDKVQPFPQPEPVTDAEKVAVKFKPSLVIKNGCQPYPAVNAAGETSGGLKGTGAPDGECTGSDLGSQVYSRSMLYSGKWAIMYAWYFPKDVTTGFLPFMKNTGVRHCWLSVVVWLDDVALESPTVLATSAPGWSVYDYSIEKPVDRAHLEGTTSKMMCEEDAKSEHHTINPSTENGEFQDLIQWEQMTDEAREALEVTDFGEDNNVPFIDAFFESSLKEASTIHVRVRRHQVESKSIWEE